MRLFQNAFRGLRNIGLHWSISISLYAGLGLFIFAANHGYWSQHLATYTGANYPNLPSFAFGVQVGLVGAASCILMILIYFALIGPKASKPSNAAHYEALVVAIIVFGIGFVDASIVPVMLNIPNVTAIFFLSSIVGLSAYFHLENLQPERVWKFSTIEIKLAHTEALEVFKVMVQVFLVFLVSVILYALVVNYRPSTFAPGSLEQQSSVKSTFLILADVGYGILGYVLFCLGAALDRLHMIRSGAHRIGKSTSSQ